MTTWQLEFVGKLVGRTSALVFLIFVIGLSGCDRDVGTLEIEVLTSPLPSQNPFPDEAARARIRVEGPGMGVQTAEFAYESGARGRLPSVPVGRERVITLDVLNDSGGVIAYGRSLPLSVTSGDNQIELYVVLVSRSSLGAEELIPVVSRGGHSAVPLRDGRVALVAGGEELDTSTFLPRAPLRSVSIFDPTSGRVVEQGDCVDPDGGEIPGSEPYCLRFPRIGAAVTGTDAGDVIVAGGVDEELVASRVVERLARGRRIFDVVGGPLAARIDAVTVPWNGGRIALLGGRASGDALSETFVLFDESGESFDEIPNPSDCLRAGGAVAALGQTVLVFGGEDDEGAVEDYGVLSLTDEIPLETCVPLPGAVTARVGAVSAVIDDRYAVFIGGLVNDRIVSDEVDIYDAETGIFCNVGSLNVPRYLHDVATLPRDRLLVVGGVRSLETSTPESGEILDLGLLFAAMQQLPDDIPNPCIELADNLLHSEVRMAVNRIAPSVVELDNGMFLISGGFDGSGVGLSSVELYVPDR